MMRAIAVTFKTMNMGPSPHNIGVIAADDANMAMGVTGMPIKVSETVDMGKSAIVTVELKPGKYTVICDVPGHVQLGMIVPITVT